MTGGGQADGEESGGEGSGGEGEAEADADAPSPCGRPLLGVAKGSVFGPPLDVNGAAKLRWNDDLGLESELVVTQAPLNLR